MSGIWALVASIVALAAGPLVYRAARGRERVLAVLDGVVVFSVGATVLVAILPEAFAQVGWTAAIPLVVGLLGPTLLERWLHSLESVTHGAALGLVALGLAAHAVTDGVALAVGDEHHWHSLPVAVVLHQVPKSLVLWRLMDAVPSRALAVLGLMAVATVVGYAAGGALEAHRNAPVFGYFLAFVGGSLLHVVVHTLRPASAHRH